MENFFKVRRYNGVAIVMETEEEDVWCVGPLNFLKEVRVGTNIPSTVIINDQTVREGEETPGLALRPEEKAIIASELDEIGVPQISAGLPETKAGVKAICQLGLRAKIEMLIFNTENWKDDLDVAIDYGVDLVCMGFLGSRLMRLLDAERLSDEQIVRRAIDMVEYVHAHGLTASIIPIDSTRTDWMFLRKFYSDVTEAGADRICIADSVGAIGPLGMRFMVREAKQVAHGAKIEVHCHNDFGQAMANALAAVEEGAEIVDVTVNGLGSRTGIPSLAQVAVALSGLYGIRTGIKLKGLCRVSRFVQDLTRISASPQEPIVGEFAFANTVEFDVQGASLDPFFIRAIRAQAVGNEEKIILGKYSGPISVTSKLSEIGVKMSDENFPNLMSKILEHALWRKRGISDGELKEIMSDLASSDPKH